MSNIFSQIISLFNFNSRAAPPMAPDDVYVLNLFPPIIIRFKIYHNRELRPTWRTSTVEKTERSCVLQHLSTFMGDTLTSLIPALIGSVLLSQIVAFCSP